MPFFCIGMLYTPLKVMFGRKAVLPIELDDNINKKPMPSNFNSVKENIENLLQINVRRI